MVEHESIMLVAAKLEVGGGGKHHVHGAELLGNKTRDVVEVLALHDHTNVEAAAHQVASTHLVILRNSAGETVKTASALRRDLHLDVGDDPARSDLLVIDHSMVAENDAFLLQLGNP